MAVVLAVFGAVLLSLASAQSSSPLGGGWNIGQGYGSSFIGGLGSVITGSSSPNSNMLTDAYQQLYFLKQLLSASNNPQLIQEYFQSLTDPRTPKGQLSALLTRLAQNNPLLSRQLQREQVQYFQFLSQLRTLPQLGQVLSQLDSLRSNPNVPLLWELGQILSLLGSLPVQVRNIVCSVADGVAGNSPLISPTGLSTLVVSCDVLEPQYGGLAQVIVGLGNALGGGLLGGGLGSTVNGLTDGLGYTVAGLGTNLGLQGLLGGLGGAQQGGLLTGLSGTFNGFGGSSGGIPVQG